MAWSERDKLLADLSAYLDGELDPRRAGAVEELLSRSEEARRTLAELRTVSEGLRKLPRAAAPAELAPAVRREVERRLLFDDRSPRRRVMLTIVARITASAAVIVACVAAGWLAIGRTGRPVPSAGIAERPAPPTVSEAERAAEREGLARGEPLVGRGGIVQAEPSPAEAMALQADAIAKPLAAATEGAGARPSLGYAGGGEQDALDHPSADLRLAGRVARGLITSEEGVPSGTTLLDVESAEVDAAPIVLVTVAPHSANEYRLAQQTVALWYEHASASWSADECATSWSVSHEGSDGVLAQPLAATPPSQSSTDAANASHGRLPAAGAGEQVEAVVPAPRVGELLWQLEQHAPQQVRVTVSFQPQDWSRVQQALGTYFEQSDTTPTAQQHGLAVVQLGQPVAQPADGKLEHTRQPESPLSAEPAPSAAPDDQPALPWLGDARWADQPDRDAAEAKQSDTAAATAQPAPLLQRRAMRAPQPAQRTDGGGGASGALRAGEAGSDGAGEAARREAGGVAAQDHLRKDVSGKPRMREEENIAEAPALPADEPARAARDAFGELRAAVERLTAWWFDLASSAGAAQAADPTPIRVQVTLLPPAEPVPTSQPVQGQP